MTARPQHTPGPWKIQQLGGHAGYPEWFDYAVRCERTNVHLATIGNVDRYYERNNEANARLIASAPDLLAALKALAGAAHTSAAQSVPFAHDSNALTAAEAAIARAEGRDKP